MQVSVLTISPWVPSSRFAPSPLAVISAGLYETGLLPV